MWIPQSAVELLAGLPNVVEGPALEFKQKLPDPGKNEDIAVDVAAMTTDGGMIIYGVAEDKVLRTFSATPVLLDGVVERVTNVVKSRVAGSPSFDAFPLDAGNGTGFLVVSVPASMNAPHQVTVKGNYRFYGRGPGGNVILVPR